jgi:hypothetical protein
MTMRTIVNNELFDPGATGRSTPRRRNDGMKG